MFVFKSQYEHVSQKMQAFRQGSDEQAAYIAERSEVTRAVMKVSVYRDSSDNVVILTSDRPLFVTSRPQK